jgi:hypothetical protein
MNLDLKNPEDEYFVNQVLFSLEGSGQMESNRGYTSPSRTRESLNTFGIRAGACFRVSPRPAKITTVKRPLRRTRAPRRASEDYPWTDLTRFVLPAK